MRRADGLDESFLASLAPALTRSIRQRGVVHHHPSGDLIVSEADGRWTGILLAGMARVFLRTETGRQVTLRHPRPGASIGIAAVLGESSVSAQAVTRCTVLALDPDEIRVLARSQPALAMAVAKEVSTVLADTQREMVLREQGSVRKRIARQLLTVAGAFDPTERLAVPMSHEELAESIGSAREVVTRHLNRLQAEGLVELDRGQITLLDPVGLDDAAA